MTTTDNHGALLARVERLSRLRPNLYNKDFLLTWEQSDEAISFVHEAAALLRDIARAGHSLKLFDSGLAVSLFRDHSTRTRYAFRSACNLLGLATEELDETTSQVSHGETARETAAMISFLTEVVGVRDDMYLGEGHTGMVEMSSALDESHREGVALGRPAVINLQCDLDHPTQSLADLSHLTTVFGSLEALRGKRLVMSWAHSPSYGKPLSVPQGIIGLLPRFGVDVVLAHPEGYELENEALDAARRFATQSGGAFSTTNDMSAAFRDADVVYPKSWAPAWVMRERTKLLRARDTAGLKSLEAKCLEHNATHKDWECDASKMALTRDGKAVYMHCLPADVTGVSCKAGEVSRDVFEAARLGTYREASHKPWVIAAMILATRIANPSATLRDVVTRAKPRRP